MRPSELALDESSEWLSWQHAISTLEDMSDQPEIGAFVSIPTTSPLRTVEDVDTCISTFLEDDTDIVITVTPAAHNPYYNMVTTDEYGYARQVIDAPKVLYRRDAYPQVYDMTTVAYVARPNFILNSVSPFEGRVKAVQIPTERALDIDTEMDMKFAEFVLRERMKHQSGRNSTGTSRLVDD